MQRETGFCVECRDVTSYTLQKKLVKKMIRGEELTFEITCAICDRCGEFMSVPGIIDLNVREVDEQYRKLKDLVTIEDIYTLMKLYNIGKAPLSIVLGFGEITITRYLLGQVPSKEYSDVIRNALFSPEYMEQKMLENKDKIAMSAFKKSMTKVNELKNIFTVSNKMIGVISYIFERMDEVTPLMLQKLLYYIQGFSFALNDREMFIENCEAWVHGPVYKDVYNIFKHFRYNVIDDPKFVMFEGYKKYLDDKDKYIIDLVVNTFGQYGGKILEKTTHKESPWLFARNGYRDNVPSNEIISKETIKEYFHELINEYDKKFDEVFDQLQHEENIKQKIFFEGQIYDAYSLIIDIIKKANKKILIIDNYIDDSVLKMLTKKNNNVEVVILTSDKSNIQQIDIQKFNKEYPILKIAKTNKFHDRFIVIDNKEMYHLGASIKDLGKKCFGINKIEDVEIMEKILNHK